MTMKPLPKSDQALVLRTDFSNDSAWAQVCAAIRRPVDGFLAYVEFVDDPAFRDITTDQVVELGRDIPMSYIIVADRDTIALPDHTLLIVDLAEEPGRTFRAIPSQIQSIENNLSIANLDFREFAEAAGTDGVYRGYPPTS